ncbi:MAG: FGGY-family carbohydrate kinase [Planctomycetes bacterium]|nr:FGGY-family carbohydrate kinase [Planctomycetota bacterium]
MTRRQQCFLGVDVGTGSARAGVFDQDGKMLALASRDIQVWRPQADFVEQSSGDIWRAVCAATKMARKDAGIAGEQVHGIGFDATCSLVVLGAKNQPVSVSPSGKDERNVMVWMDHRAIDQAKRINASNHEVLKYVGGSISPEMQTPKLLWIKEHMPQTWQRAGHFLDLPDYLTYRATGDATRSLCTTVCKWTYLGHADGVGAWNDSFFREVGLGDLVDEGYRRIGQRVRPMGEPIGSGLNEEAAEDLGLTAGTPVGVSAIDAHAGGIGLLGVLLAGAAPADEDWDTRVALIGGTSSCHMAVSPQARFIPGVWGPYYSAMVPGLWLNEGGQSATGALIDHVISSHARGTELCEASKATGKSSYGLLNERLARLASAHAFPARLTDGLHVLPYFHGNRSPRADATLRGMVSGLTLGDTLDDLALLYLATIQAIAHGTRHILDTLCAHGYRIDTVVACGGGTKNPVFLQEHADITGCRMVLPGEREAVLLGSAMLGAVASGHYDSVPVAMAAMNSEGTSIAPGPTAVRDYHAAKHDVFLRMYEDQQAYRSLMRSVVSE